MVYRYTLPAQRSPYACQQREICLRSQTISNAMASSPGLKRASLYAHKSLNSKEALLDYRTRAEEFNKENVNITSYSVSWRNVLDENVCQYDPADPTTWGIKPLPPLPHGSGPRKALSITSSSDDDAKMLQSPILPPCADPAEDANNLARLIGDHLRIDDEQQSHGQHRTTSSFYHDPDSEPSGVQSPISSGNVNMFSVTDLAKYGKTNDRLSNLGSGTPSSDIGHLLLHESSDAQDGSSLVVNDEQTQPSKMAEPYPYGRHLRRYRFASFPCDLESDNHGRGYDGVDENVVSSRHSLAPSSSASVDGRSPVRRAKRRASHFSLRSLSKPFSKRSFLGLRRWANSIYRKSSRRFSIAKQKMTLHTETERRGFFA